MEFMQYSDNMNAVVSLPDGYDELFVYDGRGNLKGFAQNQKILGKNLCFITVFGEHPETLVFHIGNGQKKQATSKKFGFKRDQVLGTINKPVIIDLDKLDGIINIFPNPFTNEITLSVQSDISQEISTQLFSITGQLVYSKRFDLLAGEHSLKIIPMNIDQGIYQLHVVMNNTKAVYKVIKK